MNLTFRYLIIIVVLFLCAGCAKEDFMRKSYKDIFMRKSYELADKRVPIGNQNLNDSDTPEKINTPDTPQEDYYAFNSHNEKVNYYKPPKEVFLNHRHNKKKSTDRKKIRIYKKIPKKQSDVNINDSTADTSSVIDSQDHIDSSAKKKMVKVIPKKNIKEPVKDHTHVHKPKKSKYIKLPKGGMDRVHLEDQIAIPSKLDIEKDAAGLEQDYVFFGKSDSVKHKSSSSDEDAHKDIKIKKHMKHSSTNHEEDVHSDKVDQETDIETHDLKSKPIPLIFD